MANPATTSAQGRSAEQSNVVFFALLSRPPLPGLQAVYILGFMNPWQSGAPYATVSRPTQQCCERPRSSSLTPTAILNLSVYILSGITMVKASFLKSRKGKKVQTAVVAVATTAAPVIAAIAADVATFPGAQALITTVNQIIELYQKVKKNEEECREIAQRVHDLAMILVDVTLRARQEDLQVALVEDVKRFGREPVKIRDSMASMAARGFLERIANKNKDAETLRKYLDNLHNAEGDFSIFNEVSIRVFQSYAHTTNMEAHGETAQTLVRDQDSLSRAAVTLAVCNDPRKHDVKFTNAQQSNALCLTLTAFFLKPLFIGDVEDVHT